jgi:hypothetical protein
MSDSKRLRVSLTVIFGAIMAAVSFAVPANAAPGPYVFHPTTSVSNATPTAGSSIQFCGVGFLPGETVTIFLDENRGGHGTQFPSVVAKSPAGNFCTTIALGANLNGAQKLTATGTTSGGTSTTKIRVVKKDVKVHGVSASTGTSANSGFPVQLVGASASTGTSGFAGTNAIGIGALGGLLLVGGPLMVLTGRRRKVND